MPVFVVHRHKAKNLHWDLRLEMKNRLGTKVLKSWAVPKEPPRTKGVKRLAIQVDDHAFSYRNFEGTITEGYGKGTVKIWDLGKYKMISCKKNKIVFSPEGKKLRGEYILLKFKDKSCEGIKDSSKISKSSALCRNWLLFKK